MVIEIVDLCRSKFIFDCECLIRHVGSTVRSLHSIELLSDEKDYYCQLFESSTFQTKEEITTVFEQVVKRWMDQSPSTITWSNIVHCLE